MIDGTDGSGKATQTKMLADRLRRAGLEVEIADFPQYNTKSAGLVEEYLSGKYGDADNVGPYKASVFYACDRYDASFKIRKWLNEGKIVISNRYVTANMGHQGGKIYDALERKAYFDWLYKLEYELLNIPKPNLNIILHVPAEISQKLSQQREKIDWEGKTNDIHQENIKHLESAEKVYLEIANTFPNFTLIECVRNGQFMPREEINELVWHEVMHLLSSQLIKIHSHDYIFHNDMPSKKNNCKLTVERLSPFAKLPTRAHKNDAGLDLYSAENCTLFSGDIAGIKTGIKMQIPDGHAGLIWDKSGLARAGLHTLGGVIDSGYRGEIVVLIKNLSEDIFNISAGQKIAQILIQKIEALEVAEGEISDETERDGNGFGSSGIF